MMTPAAVEADQTRDWVHDSTGRALDQKERAQSAGHDGMVHEEGPWPQLCRCALNQQAEIGLKIHGHPAIPNRGGGLCRRVQLHDPYSVYHLGSKRVWQGL